MGNVNPTAFYIARKVKINKFENTKYFVIRIGRKILMNNGIK